VSRLLRRRPSPALVVATIALVVACAGTATAAGVLIKRSSQVARGAINSGDLANDRAVALRDLTPETRLALQNDAGPTGPQGERGAQGPPGGRGELGPRGEDGARGPGGADGTAVAYAYVTKQGNLATGGQKGVDGASRVDDPFTIYCFDLAEDVKPLNVVASLDLGDVAQQGTFDATIYPLLTYSPSAALLDNCPASQRDAAAFISSATSIGAFWIVFN